METQITVLFVAAAVFGLSACNASVPQPADDPSSAQASTSGEVAGVRDGRTTLAVGQTLLIALPSNATTGYSWTPSGSDDAVLAPGSPFGQEVADPHAPGMAGVGGTTSWRFLAAKPGAATLTFAYGRPWERDTPPAETATYTITVR